MEQVRFLAYNYKTVIKFEVSEQKTIWLGKIIMHNYGNSNLIVISVINQIKKLLMSFIHSFEVWRISDIILNINIVFYLKKYSRYTTHDAIFKSV